MTEVTDTDAGDQILLKLKIPWKVKSYKDERLEQL